MFGIGIPELLLILAIALIVIGPQKLPDLAKSLGRAMREFKKASTELKDSLQLDEDLDDVRRSFSDFKTELKDSIDATPDAPPPAKKSTEKKVETDEPGVDQKIDDLEQAYRKWHNHTPPDAPGNDEEKDKGVDTSTRRDDSSQSDDRTEL